MEIQLSRFKYDFHEVIKIVLLNGGHVYVHRSLEVWGSPEALAREKKLRKEAEIEYRESKYIQFKAELTEKQLVNETCVCNNCVLPCGCLPLVFGFVGSSK